MVVSRRVTGPVAALRPAVWRRASAFAVVRFPAVWKAAGWHRDRGSHVIRWRALKLLGKILLHFTEPMFFITDFATLLAIGLILAWAVLRTGALWFSIGLHAGWIMSFKAFNILLQDSA